MTTLARLGKFQHFVDDLAGLDDEMRFEYVLDMAKKHKDDPFSPGAMDDEHLMHGCMSRVWMLHDIDDDGRHWFRGHSDGAIVNGLVHMMTESFSGLTGEELAALTIDQVRRLNLGAMTTQRQVGMMAMLKHMQKLARQDRSGAR
ncbi:MAG: SufE family protein [Alphaproteobacteria bacterium]|nr:SufE family protein [Alphaproteobacteria bacterium]